MMNTDNGFSLFFETFKKFDDGFFCGDINTAHEEIDLARPKENETKNNKTNSENTNSKENDSNEQNRGQNNGENTTSSNNSNKQENPQNQNENSNGSKTKSAYFENSTFFEVFQTEDENEFWKKISSLANSSTIQIKGENNTRTLSLEQINNFSTTNESFFNQSGNWTITGLRKKSKANIFVDKNMKKKFEIKKDFQNLWKINIQKIKNYNLILQKPVMRISIWI